MKPSIREIGADDRPWLHRCLPMHRQLRPQLAQAPEHYAQHIGEIMSAGARLTIAIENENVLGLALWRVIDKTLGRELYVDDLVTDAGHRSQGIGRALIAYLADRARELGCMRLALDSGTQRHTAHRFYLREGFAILSFRFTRAVTSSP